MGYDDYIAIPSGGAIEMSVMLSQTQGIFTGLWVGSRRCWSNSFENQPGNTSQPQTNSNEMKWELQGWWQKVAEAQRTSHGHQSTLEPFY